MESTRGERDKSIQVVMIACGCCSVLRVEDGAEWSRRFAGVSAVPVRMFTK